MDNDALLPDRVGDVYVRDISAGTTQLASVDYLGFGSGDGQSKSPVVSADGSVVAFSSVATNLNALDSSDNEDIYAFDRATGELRWVSHGLSYGDGDAGYDGGASVSLSGNGQVVAFTGYTGRYVAFAYNMSDGSTRELGNCVEPKFVDYDWGRKPTLNYDGSVAAFESGTDVYVASIEWDAPPLVGDYNRDGSVDAADYTVWRSALGQHDLVAYSSADGNGNGSVDELDYAVWKSHFGERLAPARTPMIVDTLEDEDDGDLSPGDVSLREALAVANARPGLDQILFADALTAARPATIRLSLGELEIADAVEIVGPGDELLTIDAQEQSRVLSVALITGDVALRGMTLKNGRTTGSGEVYDDLTYSGGADLGCRALRRILAEHRDDPRQSRGLGGVCG